MRAYTFFSLGLSLLLVGISSFRGSAAPASSEMNTKAIDEYVTAKMRSARIPGVALVIVKGDQIVYFKGYGQADPSGRPVTLQTPFMIGSITKSMTALAVMQLVEAGQVELDAPVQRYIPWFRVADPQASAQITVRQLIVQTSGIPQPMTSQMITDLDDGALERSVRALATEKLVSPPGQSFTYSNGNYNTLGLIVQTVSGQSYEEYVKQHIFAPLHMQNSFVSQAEAEQHGMAMGYRWWFGVPVPATFPYDRSDLPAGYIISSAEDMAHYLIAQMNDGRYGDASVLSPEGIALIHTPVPTPYGLGWEFLQDNGRTLVNHDGGTPNFMTSLFFDPQERVGVYVAANICGALDTFTSPPGASVLDGATVRAMAHSVLSLATNQPMPDQGPGHALLYTLLDLVLLALTGALGISLARIPGRYQRLAQRGITRWSDLAWRSGLAAVLHFVWPLWVLYEALGGPTWKTLVMYQPDLGYWLETAGAIVFLKGLVEIALAWRVFRRTHQSQVRQPITGHASPTN